MLINSRPDIASGFIGQLISTCRCDMLGLRNLAKVTANERARHRPSVS